MSTLLSNFSVRLGVLILDICGQLLNYRHLCKKAYSQKAKTWINSQYHNYLANPIDSLLEIDVERMRQSGTSLWWALVLRLQVAPGMITKLTGSMSWFRIDAQLQKVEKKELCLLCSACKSTVVEAILKRIKECYHISYKLMMWFPHC